MREFFGGWVALGIFSGTLGVVLVYYGLVEWRREEGSSFFSREFLWRLLLAELILGELSFVLGISFGSASVGTDDRAMGIFLRFLVILISVALMAVQYNIIVWLHKMASKSRRLQGRRVFKAV